MRPLHAVPASDLAACLPAALDGAGPALLPLPPEAGARAAVVDALRPDDPSVPLERRDVAVVVTTSGSTGLPSGVMLSASALLRSAQAAHLRLGGEGQWLLALPQHHIAGLQVLVRSLVARTEPIVQDLSDGFSAAGFVAASRVLDGDRRYTSLVPTQLRRLLDAGAAEALRRFDAILVGGAAAPALIDRARAEGVNVVGTYGMSETCGGCVYDGLPLDGVSVDIADDGRIVIAGPTVFAGYRLRPDLTAATLVGGRLITQDKGFLGPDGRLEVIGRFDDVVVTGGVNVSLAAVEGMLNDQPGVVESAVVALPDADWGQRIVAYVVASSDVDVSGLCLPIRTRLGRAAVPRDVHLVDELPQTGPGKVDRQALRTRASQR